MTPKVIRQHKEPTEPGPGIAIHIQIQCPYDGVWFSISMVGVYHLCPKCGCRFSVYATVSEDVTLIESEV